MDAGIIAAIQLNSRQRLFVGTQNEGCLGSRKHASKGNVDDDARRNPGPGWRLATTPARRRPAFEARMDKNHMDHNRQVGIIDARQHRRFEYSAVSDNTHNALWLVYGISLSSVPVITPPSASVSLEDTTQVRS